MSEGLTTSSLSKEAWLAKYVPNYKKDPALPESMEMCMVCKSMCERDNKPWPPCGNKELNKGFQYESLEQSGALDKLDDETKIEIRARMDPAFWAALEFEFDGKPWVPRWYQEWQLRCVSLNKVSLWGRRCLIAGTEVLMADGSTKNIEDIEISDIVASRDKHKVVAGKVTYVFDNGVQEVKTITLKDGNTLTMTNSHELWSRKFNTTNDYYETPSYRSIDSGLAVGDLVAVIRRVRPVKQLANRKKFDTGGDFKWVKVTAIEDAGSQQTYDITVGKYHNFVANNISSSNSGKSETSIIETLHHVRYRIGAEGDDLNYGAHVLVNSETLQEHHWDEFMRFVDNSRTLKGMYEGGNKGVSIKFNNKAAVHLHILSMKQLGLDTYFMWFDEAAFYAEKDKAISHVLAIRISHPNVPVLMTSNSSGFQGRFYEFFKAPTTYALQLPSYVNPDWSMKHEIDSRYSFTSEEYARLIKAEWGESSEGVFKPGDIDYCLNAFSYSNKDVSVFKKPGAFRCLGCDWNESDNGVHFVITEYDPSYTPEGKALFRVINKTVVRGEEWNHQIAVRKAWELLTLWNCDAAYLDYGGGGNLNVETLKRVAQEQHRMDLANNIVPVNMSSNVELPDPLNPMIKIKKRQKNLMVSLAQRLLEKHQTAWPHEETFDIGEALKTASIIPQMRDFRVEKTDSRGQAIYSSTLEEHTLTAWMLSVYGCVVNKTDMLVNAQGYDTPVLISKSELPSDKKETKAPVPTKVHDATIVKRGKGLPGWGSSGFGSRTGGFNRGKRTW